MTETTPTTTPTPPEGLTDEQLKNIWETGHLPTDQEIADDDGENDLQFMFTSAYYRWLDENPEEQEKHDAKCLRAVFNAGVNWSRPTPAPVPSFLDAIRLANGCHDYSGGYGGAEGEAWHAGIGTVVTVLRQAAAGPWDSQVTAVFAMGADTPAPTPEELEPQLLAWWAVPPDAFDRRTKAGKDQAVAFALHLLGLGVQ